MHAATTANRTKGNKTNHLHKQQRITERKSLQARAESNADVATETDAETHPQIDKSKTPHRQT